MQILDTPQLSPNVDATERGDAEVASPPFSLKMKLFVVLAISMLVAIEGLVEFSLHEQRELAVGTLKRDGARFANGVALANSDAMLAGDRDELRAFASNLMRRPEILFIRFDSPQTDDPLIVARAGFSPAVISAAALEAGVASSRLTPGDGTLLLEVVVPLSTIVPAIPLEDTQAGEHLLPVSGSLVIGVDATETLVVLLASASRLRQAQAGAAAFILLVSWIAIRRALHPLGLLAAAAQRFGTEAEFVEFSRPTTQEAYQLTIGLAAIQKRLGRSAGGRRSGAIRQGSTPGSRHAMLGGRRAGDPKVRQQDESAQRVQSPGSGRHILLVEDNPVNRSVAVGMLEALGCTIVCAEDGLASLAAIEDESFDLIFMDIQMPRMDGREATRRIREQEKEAGSRATPIIALTAHSQLEDRATSAQAGMNDHISKPFTREDLSRAIQAWCVSKKNADLGEG